MPSGGRGAENGGKTMLEKFGLEFVLVRAVCYGFSYMIWTWSAISLLNVRAGWAS